MTRVLEGDAASRQARIGAAARPTPGDEANSRHRNDICTASRLYAGPMLAGMPLASFHDRPHQAHVNPAAAWQRSGKARSPSDS
jgi:hypothetical protein